MLFVAILTSFCVAVEAQQPTTTSEQDRRNEAARDQCYNPKCYTGHFDGVTSDSTLRTIYLPDGTHPLCSTPSGKISVVKAVIACYFPGSVPNPKYMYLSNGTPNTASDYQYQDSDIIRVADVWFLDVSYVLTVKTPFLSPLNNFQLGVLPSTSFFELYGWIMGGIMGSAWFSNPTNATVMNFTNSFNLSQFSYVVCGWSDMSCIPTGYLAKTAELNMGAIVTLSFGLRKNTTKTVYLPDASTTNLVTYNMGSDVKKTIIRSYPKLFPQASLIYLTNYVTTQFINDWDSIGYNVTSLKADYVLKVKTPLRAPNDTFYVGATPKTTFAELNQILITTKAIKPVSMTFTPVVNNNPVSAVVKCVNSQCPSGSLSSIDFKKNATVTITLK